MKYKIEIEREDCIACGNCYTVDPNHFEAGEEGYSRVIGGTTTRDFSEGTFNDDDIDKAKSVIAGLIKADQRVLGDPEPFIAVSELADSSVNLVARVWVNSANYWGVFFDLTENVKKSFDKEGISIPFPQRDVHVYNEK